MNDRVAVLRRMRESLPATFAARDKRASLDHAIATCGQHAALVARLGELEQAWRGMDYDGWRADEAFRACADALARVVAGNGGGE